MADSSPDPWTDLADDIRRPRDAVREMLADLLIHTGRLGGWAYMGREVALDQASDLLELAAAGKDYAARFPAAGETEARVPKLQAEAKALADDRGKLMRVLTVQTGETMRFHDACEAAIAMLREDRPQAALALLEETIGA